MDGKEEPKEEKMSKEISRRTFLKAAAGLTAGLAAAACRRKEPTQIAELDKRQDPLLANPDAMTGAPGTAEKFSQTQEAIENQPAPEPSPKEPTEKVEEDAPTPDVIAKLQRVPISTQVSESLRKEAIVKSFDFGVGSLYVPPDNKLNDAKETLNKAFLHVLVWAHEQPSTLTPMSEEDLYAKCRKVMDETGGLINGISAFEGMRIVLESDDVFENEEYYKPEVFMPNGEPKFAFKTSVSEEKKLIISVAINSELYKNPNYANGAINRAITNAFTTLIYPEIKDKPYHLSIEYWDRMNEFEGAYFHSFTDGSAFPLEVQT